MDGSNTEDRRENSASTDRRNTEGTGNSALATPTIDDTGGLGLSMTLLTGMLLALGYYGVQSVSEAGLGQAIPTPFYMLALALVFVVEITRNPSIDARGLARAVGVTAVYGTLVVLAIEGVHFSGRSRRLRWMGSPVSASSPSHWWSLSSSTSGIWLSFSEPESETW